MDVILGALITARGGDPFLSAKKLGGEHREPADLTAAELADYLAPFLGNARAYPDVPHVLLHDGLPDEATAAVIVPASFRFERVGGLPARHANYERRFFAFRDWLDRHPEVGRVWCVDANDVAFASHPLRWLDGHGGGGFACGEEWTRYGDNPWFRDAWPLLPAEYGAAVTARHLGRYPVTVGCMGGPRAAVLAVLAGVCGHADRMRDHLDANPPPHALMLDMHALAAVVLDAPGVVTFKQDGRTPTSAGVPSPVIHQRDRALEHQRRQDGPLSPLRAALAHTQTLPGWCWDAKAEAMARLVLDTAPAVVAEIGVYGGRSLLAQALALRQAGRGVAYGIDPWARAPSLEGNQFGDAEQTARACWTDAHLTDLYAGVVAATVALGLASHVRFLCACSHHVAGAFPDAGIDILHIDGNHCEEAARRDVALYLPKVRPGGFVWVDDANWDSVRPALALVETECVLVRELAQEPDHGAKGGGCVRLYRQRAAPG